MEILCCTRVPLDGLGEFVSGMEFSDYGIIWRTIQDMIFIQRNYFKSVKYIFFYNLCKQISKWNLLGKTSAALALSSV